jgi:hypothetical protein
MHPMLTRLSLFPRVELPPEQFRRLARGPFGQNNCGWHAILHGGHSSHEGWRALIARIHGVNLPAAFTYVASAEARLTRSPSKLSRTHGRCCRF